MSTGTWSWELGFTAAAVGEARGLVRAVLNVEKRDGQTMGVQAVDDAVLIVSEVVTNAVVHGRAPLIVSLANEDHGWHLRVHDGKHTGPELRPASLTAQGSRGMRLVATTSQRWGVDRIAGDGKDVWVDL